MEKKQKSITPKRIENIALYYLSRYESSSLKLRNMLRNRIEKYRLQGSIIPPQAFAWIEETVNKMERLGYIDDKRYAETVFRSMKGAYKSRRQIEQKLLLSGISDSLISELCLCDYDERETALKFARKFHLGKDKDNYAKDLAKMSRAGFSYEVASKAIKECREESESANPTDNYND